MPYPLRDRSKGRFKVPVRPLQYHQPRRDGRCRWYSWQKVSYGPAKFQSFMVNFRAPAGMHGLLSGHQPVVPLL